MPLLIKFIDIYHSTENDRSLRWLGIIAAEGDHRGHATTRYNRIVREDIEKNKRHVGAAVVKINEAKTNKGGSEISEKRPRQYVSKVVRRFDKI
mgnify:CR=1 FL=1